MENHIKSTLIDVSVSLKAYRLAAGLSQEEVYKATGINVARIESLHRDMMLSTVFRLLVTYNVAPETFFSNL